MIKALVFLLTGCFVVACSAIYISGDSNTVKTKDEVDSVIKDVKTKK